MLIRQDDLTGNAVQQLLKTHLEDAYKNSPADSVFALDVSELLHPEITFWTIWKNRNLLGCGALKQLDESHGEIKSMRTHEDALGQGVGSAMLTHIIKQARQQGFNKLSLETGNNDAYAPARNLYQKFGFTTCGPFADYELNKFSVFMSRAL